MKEQHEWIAAAQTGKSHQCRYCEIAWGTLLDQLRYELNTQFPSIGDICQDDCEVRRRKNKLKAFM